MNPKREGNGKNNQGSSPKVRPNLRMVSSVSWRDISPSLIADLVRITTSNGAAIMFGITSDSGAFSICILDNANKIKEYPRDDTELLSILTWLQDEYFAVSKPPAA